MRIIVGKFIIVEQRRVQKRHYDNTRAVKMINTSPSRLSHKLPINSKKVADKSV